MSNSHPHHFPVGTKFPNSRNTRYRLYKGRRMCLQDWADTLGIHPSTISKRIARGWSLDDMLTLRRYHPWKREMMRLARRCEQRDSAP